MFRHARQLHQIADDKPDLYLIRQNPLFQSFIVPGVDRALSADGKAQMPPVQDIYQWSERFAEIHGPHASACFRRQYVIDDTPQQDTLAATWCSECQHERRTDKLSVKEIKADQFAGWKRKQRMRTGRSAPLSFGGNEGCKGGGCFGNFPR